MATIKLKNSAKCPDLKKCCAKYSVIYHDFRRILNLKDNSIRIMTLEEFEKCRKECSSLESFDYYEKLSKQTAKILNE